MFSLCEGNCLLTVSTGIQGPLQSPGVHVFQCLQAKRHEGADMCHRVVFSRLCGQMYSAEVGSDYRYDKEKDRTKPQLTQLLHDDDGSGLAGQLEHPCCAIPHRGHQILLMVPTGARLWRTPERTQVPGSRIRAICRRAHLRLAQRLWIRWQRRFRCSILSSSPWH